MWTAVAFGALDLRESAFEDQGFEIVVVPVHPGVPVFLMGQGAEVWRSLLDDPVDDREVDSETLEVLATLEQMGLASRDEDTEARVSQLTAPWLVSPLHELVYALIARVARAHAIDVFFIKGPTLHAQGLREREHSGDVDCWVRPGDDVRLAEAMRSWGWTPLFSPFTGTGVTHSLTLEAGEWGCSIDVHTRYPGVDLAMSDAFELALAETEPRVFASTVCATPRHELHGIIAALHSVRPFIGTPARDSNHREAAHALGQAGSGAIEMAERLNAVYALEPSLRLAFPDLARSYPDARPPADWTWRLTPSAPRRHLRALATVPLHLRLVVVGRLLWPSAEVLEAAGEMPGTTWFGRSVWRLRRLLRAGVTLLRRD